ncbi:MAG: SCP-like extracellular protein domain [Barrevirus sp.]|uniref:SCP-like extracellular protein domain n=1 Tax=Barrevirus sp. TaxID=2487763 RepID=A0A3G4ZQN1_9VIRU|nr:MAG: SCP-like extracellular protein domain [Barrevirus sp.]
MKISDEPILFGLLIIFLIIAVINVIIVYWYKPKSIESSPLTKAAKDKNIWTPQQWLDAHNKVRDSVNLPHLIWDKQLAQDALDYANNGPTPDQFGVPSHPCDQGAGHSCKTATGFCLNNYPNYFCHSADASRFIRGVQQGENISWACPKTEYSDATIMQELIYERKKYVYPQTPKENPDSGHYTQLVNRKVTKVGCGCANCGDGARLCICRYDYYQLGDEVPY